MSGGGSRERRLANRGQVGEIREALKSANLVLEVRDARAPGLTDAARYLGNQLGKRRAVLLAKADLADPAATKAWCRRLERDGIPVIALDLTQEGRSRAALQDLLRRCAKDVRTRIGMTRAAVVGLPNVGKSTLLNRILGRHKAATGDRPGVTRGRQWIKLSETCFLLDTPGVIQVFSGLRTTLGADFFKLCVCNVVPQAEYEPGDAVEQFLGWVASSFTRWPFPRYHPGVFAEDFRAVGPGHLLDRLAVSQGLRRDGGEPDREAVARRVLLDLRRGEVGRLTLEQPPEGGEGQA